MMTITKRDAKGRILPGGKVLSSEDAKDLRSKRDDHKVIRDQILKEAGYDNPDDAPAGERNMADIAARGNYSAAKHYASSKPVKDQDATTPEGYPQPGEKCPTCHQYVLADLVMTDDELDIVIEILDL